MQLTPKWPRVRRVIWFNDRPLYTSIARVEATKGAADALNKAVAGHIFSAAHGQRNKSAPIKVVTGATGDKYAWNEGRLKNCSMEWQRVEWSALG